MSTYSPHFQGSERTRALTTSTVTSLRRHFALLLAIALPVAKGIVASERSLQGGGHFEKAFQKFENVLRPRKPSKAVCPPRKSSKTVYFDFPANPAKDCVPPDKAILLTGCKTPFVDGLYKLQPEGTVPERFRDDSWEKDDFQRNLASKHWYRNDNGFFIHLYGAQFSRDSPYQNNYTTWRWQLCPPWGVNPLYCRVVRRPEMIDPRKKSHCCPPLNLWNANSKFDCQRCEPWTRRTCPQCTGTGKIGERKRSSPKLAWPFALLWVDAAKVPARRHWARPASTSPTRPHRVRAAAVSPTHPHRVGASPTRHQRTREALAGQKWDQTIAALARDQQERTRAALARHQRDRAAPAPASSDSEPPDEYLSYH